MSSEDTSQPGCDAAAAAAAVGQDAGLRATFSPPLKVVPPKGRNAPPHLLTLTSFFPFMRPLRPPPPPPPLHTGSHPAAAPAAAGVIPCQRTENALWMRSMNG